MLTRDVSALNELPPLLRLQYELESKVDALETALETVTTQIAEGHKAIDQHIEACTRQQSCRYLVSTYKLLPRELRDIVYGYMLGPHTVNVRDQDFLRQGAASVHGKAAPTHMSSKLFWDAIVSHGYNHLSTGP
jgi:hypothetical protein